MCGRAVSGSDDMTWREWVEVLRPTVKVPPPPERATTSLAPPGANALIMAQCHIGHDCRIGDNVIFSNNVMLAGHCKVDNFAILGGGNDAGVVYRVSESGAGSGGSVRSCHSQSVGSRLP